VTDELWARAVRWMVSEMRVSKDEYAVILHPHGLKIIIFLGPLAQAAGGNIIIVIIIFFVIII